MHILYAPAKYQSLPHGISSGDIDSVYFLISEMYHGALCLSLPLLPHTVIALVKEEKAMNNSIDFPPCSFLLLVT